MGKKKNIKTWSVGLKGWGRKPGGCSGKSDVTGVIILGFLQGSSWEILQGMVPR